MLFGVPFTSKAGILKLKCAYKSPGDLVKIQISVVGG